MIRKYRRRVIEVEAMQNDGTDNCAMAIAAWVRANGVLATAMPIGTIEEDPTHAYVHVPNERAQKMAAPDYWVVKLPEGAAQSKFHVVSNHDFTYLYEEINLNPEEAMP